MLWEKGKSRQLSTMEPKVPACMPRAASDELQPLSLKILHTRMCVVCNQWQIDPMKVDLMMVDLLKESHIVCAPAIHFDYDSDATDLFLLWVECCWPFKSTLCLRQFPRFHYKSVSVRLSLGTVWTQTAVVVQFTQTAKWCGTNLENEPVNN